MKYPPMSGVFAMLNDKCGMASNGSRHVSGSPAWHESHFETGPVIYLRCPGLVFGGILNT